MAPAGESSGGIEVRGGEGTGNSSKASGVHSKVIYLGDHSTNTEEVRLRVYSKVCAEIVPSFFFLILV